MFGSGSTPRARTRTSAEVRIVQTLLFVIYYRLKYVDDQRKSACLFPLKLQNQIQVLDRLTLKSDSHLKLEIHNSKKNF